MHLDPLFIQALPHLRNTGSSEQAKGTFDVSTVDIGHRHFDVPAGISYDASLTNTGEAILLSGKASAELNTSCDRCLDPATLSVTGEIQGYFLFDASTVESGKSLEEYEVVDEKGRVDIAPPILAAIVFELPTVVLCEPECSGIQSEATGVESESEVTDKTEDKAQDINSLSPFAALKDFKFEE